MAFSLTLPPCAAYYRYKVESVSQQTFIVFIVQMQNNIYSKERKEIQQQMKKVLNEKFLLGTLYANDVAAYVLFLK